MGGRRKRPTATQVTQGESLSQIITKVELAIQIAFGNQTFSPIDPENGDEETLGFASLPHGRFAFSVR
jgi:hypothetical protein